MAALEGVGVDAAIGTVNANKFLLDNFKYPPPVLFLNGFRNEYAPGLVRGTTKTRPLLPVQHTGCSKGGRG